MKTRRGTFILTEAAQTLPLVRRILRDVREARSRLCRLNRVGVGTTEIARKAHQEERQRYRQQLSACLEEAAGLGVEITPGVRCEALFAFNHQWVGPDGDFKIRPAYFVFGDACDTISEWYFSGWPSDRRRVNPKWWHQYRPTPTARLQSTKQSV
jgi:hypothetical protein